MRILTITNLYPRTGHEALGIFNRQQFAAMAVHHELAVVAPVPWTEELRDRWAGHRRFAPARFDEGIEVRHPRYLFTPRFLRASYGRFFLACVRPETRRLAESFRPDIILGCWAHPDGWASVEIARELGIPAVVKVVGSDVLVVAGRARRARMIEGLRRADAVIAVSRDLAEHIAAMGVDPDRVHIVYNGLDRAKFCPGDRSLARARLGLPTETPIILFVGNLLMSKGVGILVEALADLRRRGLNLHCIFAGRGRDEPKLRSLIADHGLGGVASLVGPKPHAELPDWYRACNLVALPSYSEGIPNVLLEATACGRPFVATRVGGIPEIAAEGSSCLVRSGDPAAFADAIAEVLAWQPIADVGGAISWDESAQDLALVLKTAIDRRASRSASAAPTVENPRSRFGQ